MKSSRWPTLVQSGLLIFVLLGLGYWAWQRYHRPSAPTYEGKTLARWVKDLDDPDYGVSERAADVLVRAGVEAVPSLLEARATGDIRLHRRAAAVLLRIGAPAAPGLIDALKDKPNEQRILFPLVRMGPAAVPALIAALKDEASGQAAATVLSLIGPRAADAVPALLETLKDRHVAAGRREAAAGALGAIGTPAADIVPALIVALKDEKLEVRQHAAEALNWIGEPAREATPALVAAVEDEEEKVAVAACQALAHLGGPGAAQALFAALRNKRDPVARAAVVALWQMGPAAKSVVPALVTLLKDPPKETERVRLVLQALGPVTVPHLSAALKDEEPAIRQNAAELLAAIGPVARETRETVPALTDALKDTTPSVQLAAVVALARIDPTRAREAVPLLADAVDNVAAVQALADLGTEARAAVPALIAALKHKEKDVRESARRALASIGAPAVPALIAALKDQNDDVSDLAALALGMIHPRPKEAKSALREAFKKDRPAVAAAVALVRIDPEVAGEVVPVLIEELKAADQKRRIAAIHALGQLGAASEPAVPVLVKRLKERDLLEPILTALFRIGPAAWKATPALLGVVRDVGEEAAIPVKGVLAAIGPKAIPDLVPLLRDEDVRFRRFAASVLAAYGPSAKEIVPALIQALDDPDSDVRAEAAAALEAVGSAAQAAVPALLANLNTYQTRVRASAVWTLGHIGPDAKDARRPLLECLLDPNEDVRYAAALSLGRIDPHYTEAVPALREMLHDPAPMARLGAIDSLLRIDKTYIDEAAPMLLAMNKKPYPSNVRFKAAGGLVDHSRVKARALLPWLNIELTDMDPAFRLEAATLLTRIEPERTRHAVLAVLPALWSPAPVVRGRVVRALGSLEAKAREAVPAIVRLLQDDVPEVREEAAKALRAIDPATAKRLGID
ncbi:MAG TPA: HEAT repeat domain-containing protein [Gemmataceae bacterium]